MTRPDAAYYDPPTRPYRQHARRCDGIASAGRCQVLTKSPTGLCPACTPKTSQR